MAKNYVKKYINKIDDDCSKSKLPCEFCHIDFPESHLTTNEYDEKICIKCFNSKKCKECGTSLKNDQENNIGVCKECQIEFYYNEDFE